MATWSIFDWENLMERWILLSDRIFNSGRAIFHDQKHSQKRSQSDQHHVYQDYQCIYLPAYFSSKKECFCMKYHLEFSLYLFYHSQCYFTSNKSIAKWKKTPGYHRRLKQLTNSSREQQAHEYFKSLEQRKELLLSDITSTERLSAATGGCWKWFHGKFQDIYQEASLCIGSGMACWCILCTRKALLCLPDMYADRFWMTYL